MMGRKEDERETRQGEEDDSTRLRAQCGPSTVEGGEGVSGVLGAASDVGSTGEVALEWSEITKVVCDSVRPNGCSE